MTSYFDLNGIKLTVLSESDELLAPLLRYIGSFRQKTASPPDFTLTLERVGERLPPPDAEFLFDGPLSNGTTCRLSLHGNTSWFNVPGCLSAEISHERKIALVSVGPGSEALMGGILGLITIEAVLSSSGQALVHGAALRLPNDERAIVLFAPSGAGKTTTALALVLQGFGLLSDDASVFVEAAYQGGIRYMVWGLPRALKVHHRTRDLLPRLAPLLGESWNDEGEQVLTQDAIRSIAEVCPPRPYPLAAIVLLGKRVVGSHIVCAMNKAEAMASLAADNIRQSHRGVLDDHLVRFHRLGAAVAATPTFELRVGSDLASLGDMLLAQLLTPAR